MLTPRQISGNDLLKVTLVLVENDREIVLSEGTYFFDANQLINRIRLNGFHEATTTGWLHHFPGNIQFVKVQVLHD